MTGPQKTDGRGRKTLKAAAWILIALVYGGCAWRLYTAVTIGEVFGGWRREGPPGWFGYAKNPALYVVTVGLSATVVAFPFIGWISRRALKAIEKLSPLRKTPPLDPQSDTHPVDER